MSLQYGEIAGRTVSSRVFAQQASTAALSAIPSTGNGETFNDGMICIVGVGTTTNHLWIWQATSAASAGATVLVPVDAPAAGRWVQLV